MRYSKVSRSAAMGKLMGNPKISGVLDKKKEQREFYSALSKRASGGITKDEFRETLGELYEKSRMLSHREVKEIGRAMKDTLGKKRIEMPSEQIKENKLNSERAKQELSPKSSIESLKNFNAKPGVQNRFSPKDPDSTATESGILFSRVKKQNEKASRLLDNILNKKAA